MMHLLTTAHPVCLALLLALPGIAAANDLQITNVTVAGRDDSTAFVNFDISWENSWRWTNINHDAAWVFFKVQQEGSIEWHHVVIEGSGLNPPGFSPGQGTAIEMIVPEDRVGFFLRRSGEGAGALLATNVQAVWNFAASGFTKNSKVRLKGAALEMVYVAEGAFYLGCGGLTNEVTGSFTDGAWTGGTSTSFPFLVTSENQIAIGNNPGELWGTSSSGKSTIGGAGILSNAFPKGYAAFYCMKYYTTQGQYVDFLNSLTEVQAINRNPATWHTGIYDGLNGYTISGSWPNFTAGARDRASNFTSRLNCQDGFAFADWAGLRPMTELEYEKACRGPPNPTPAEYPWGTTNLTRLEGFSGVDGSGTETATPSTANYNGGISWMRRPVRMGIYATAGSTRESAGASYWGIMDLCGNLYERTVSVKHAYGRAFTGLHGDGVIDEAGLPDVPGWNTTGDATMCRGGAFETALTYARVSDRGDYYSAHAIGNQANFGAGRFVRTAPAWLEP